MFIEHTYDILYTQENPYGNTFVCIYKKGTFLLQNKKWKTFYWTFSNNSTQASKSIPKSIKTQSIPSALYSSCSNTNIWWLKNCCSFSFVKLIHICSKPLYYILIIFLAIRKLKKKNWLKMFRWLLRCNDDDDWWSMIYSKILQRYFFLKL